MDNQETVPAFEPTPLSDVLGRRDDARASEAPAGQQEPASPPDPTPETGATPEAKPEPHRAADGKFAPKPKDTGPPPEGNADPETVPFAAHKDERAKRQQAEKLLAERDAQIADLMRRAAPAAPAQAQVEQPKQPEEFPWDEPLRPVRELRQEFEGQIARQRFQFSEMMARSAYPDFAEAEAAFRQAVDAQARATGVPVQQTALAAGMRASDHPAEYAYRLGKQAMVLAKLGADPEAHIEAEVERRLAERLAASPSQPSSTQATALPASLAASRSAIAPRAGAWSGPTSLSDILRPRPPRG